MHQGIIDSKVWLLCQYKLDRNKQIKNNGKGKHTWLSGLSKCGYCNYAVSVVKEGHGLHYKYFICRGKTNLKICDGFSKAVKVDDIEKIVESEIFKKIEELRNVTINEESKEDIEINKIKVQVIDIDKQIENLLDNLAEANQITIKYINERLEKLDKEKNKLLQEIQKLTLENSRNVSLSDTFEKIEEWDDLDLEEKKDYLQKPY